MNWLLSHFIGKKKYQKYWNKLFQISLIGMNVGTGSDVTESGELVILKFILEKNSNKKFVVFDVGANIGKYAKILLSHQHIMQLYCFEPSTDTFELLKENLSDYEPSLVNLYNFGLSEKEGVTKLYSDNDKSGLGSIYKRRLDHFNIKMNKEEEIHLKTLDSFCFENSIFKIDFLKIDVEGNELNVLKGARNLIVENRINYIQFEFGGCDIDSRTYFQDFYYLLSPNFKIFRILKDGLLEIEKYSEYDELFITTNYLAINRNFNSVMN